MIIHVDTREKQIELEDKIKDCLKTLFELEDITNYEVKEISRCINVLQDTIISNDNRYDVRWNNE